MPSKIIETINGNTSTNVHLFVYTRSGTQSLPHIHKDPNDLRIIIIIVQQTHFKHWMVDDEREEKETFFNQQTVNCLHILSLQLSPFGNQPAKVTSPFSFFISHFSQLSTIMCCVLRSLIQTLTRRFGISCLE